jgi:large subunit ribosomal protein L30
VSGKIRITLRSSQFGALGLRRVDSCVVRPDDPSIRGMVYKVVHMVDVEAVADDGRGTGSAQG